MSEESDRVWANLSAELRKVRRRRGVAQVGSLVGIVLVGLFFIQKVIQPVDSAPAMVREEPAVEDQRAETSEPELLQLAVLVYDGEGMRFELIDGDQLARSEMEFSLQPVVMPLAEAW